MTVDYDPQEPTDEEVEQMRASTSAEAQAVDQLILGNCTAQWRKVAMIVAKCMTAFDEQFPHLPYIYMQLRVIDLEERGILETAGDVMSMRTSEARLIRALPYET